MIKTSFVNTISPLLSLNNRFYGFLTDLYSFVHRTYMYWMSLPNRNPQTVKPLAPVFLCGYSNCHELLEELLNLTRCLFY
ncbi:hypothetical protein SAMN05216308_101638 [Nitrosospira sp. Nsp13]|nr:hypothetical protein SAMN05216308_101638 [Nitrosospira sp. Nsp13]